MDYWQAFQAAKMCADKLANGGIEVRVENDFSLIPSLVEESGKGYLTPPLDPLKNDFTKQNCFWLSGRRDGRLVLLGGARVDDVGDDAAAFIKSMFNRGYGGDCVRSVAPKVNEKVSGRVAYLGDLISRSSVGLGRKNVRWFTGIANYLAASEFKADCTYSFMRGADVLLGSAERNGFDGRVRQPLVWGKKPDGRGEREQIVYRHKSDNDMYFETLIQELACKPQQPTSGQSDPLLAVQA